MNQFDRPIVPVEEVSPEPEFITELDTLFIEKIKGLISEFPDVSLLKEKADGVLSESTESWVGLTKERRYQQSVWEWRVAFYIDRYVKGGSFKGKNLSVLKLQNILTYLVSENINPVHISNMGNGLKDFEKARNYISLLIEEVMSNIMKLYFDSEVYKDYIEPEDEKLVASYGTIDLVSGATNFISGSIIDPE